MPLGTKTLHVVHCIDTEGPLTETIVATFERIKAAFDIDLPPTAELLASLQNRAVPLNGREDAIARMVAPKLLEYNSSWEAIRAMLDDALSPSFRREMLDDFGNGWVYSWHCMDHIGYTHNPRHKDVGYGNIFRTYRSILHETNSSQDELNWHFHPLSITGNPLAAATSYTNCYRQLNEILCRRIIEDDWFPVVNRPGFHSERPDSHVFLEQWIPFDYANQSHHEEDDQPDLALGRFGDWRRAPRTWKGYHPSHDDYQTAGHCRRSIFRCLNVGTRLRPLTELHVREAFAQANSEEQAILAFADHDYRDIRPDVGAVRSMIARIRRDFPEVSLRFSGAEKAAREVLGVSTEAAPRLSLELEGNRLVVGLLEGQIFGPQPFLALKGREGALFHDNLDIQDPGRLWTYTLDEQTIPLSAVSIAAVGSAGRFGDFCTAKLSL